MCNWDCKVLTTALCYGLRHVFGVLYPLLGGVRSYRTDDRQHSSGWKLQPWPTAHAWPMTAASSLQRSFVSCEGRASASSFLQPFPQTITKRASLMLRRRGCLANGFLLTKAFSPIFRWITEDVNLRDRSDTLPAAHGVCSRG